MCSFLCTETRKFRQKQHKFMLYCLKQTKWSKRKCNGSYMKMKTKWKCKLIAVQYSVFPPLACITAARLRGTLQISLQMVFWGMALHSSKNASLSSWSVQGCCGRFWIRRLSKSHRCLIQFRSGLHVGQSITWIPAASRNSLVSIAECAGAPSCINVKFCPIISAMVSTWFSRTSWM